MSSLRQTEGGLMKRFMVREGNKLKSIDEHNTAYFFCLREISFPDYKRPSDLYL